MTGVCLGSLSSAGGSGSLFAFFGVGNRSCSSSRCTFYLIVREPPWKSRVLYLYLYLVDPLQSRGRPPVAKLGKCFSTNSDVRRAMIRSGCRKCKRNVQVHP